MTAEEKELITGACKGEGACFGQLYDRHAPRIYRFIFLKTGNKNDTEDLTHEVFLAAWRTIKKYRAHENIPFTSWLYHIARNRVIDYYRTTKKTISLDEILKGNTLPVELMSEAHHTITNALHSTFEMQIIMNAVGRLNDDQQNVLIMRYVEDLSPKEIGSAIGKTASAVRVIQHRALKQLKIIIAQTNENRIPHQTT
jgi:RNA polymerase sigma-70 factor (ECF subfamily)